MHRIKLALLLICLLLTGGSIAAAQGTAPSFEYTSCWFYIAESSGEVEGDTLDCGWLTVPEVRTGPSTGNIQLAVVILYSTNPNPPADPIIYLEGGPGGSAIAAVDFWYGSALRATRDLILIDQRGTGYSLPVLNCDELDDTGEVDSTVACRASLIGNGINLAAYNSYENAHDVADLLVALDIPQANLFGVSYGTRLALTIIRERPERIRSVIIDAVYPPHVNAYDEEVVNAYRAFRVLFDNCAADAACNAAYPNLETVFYQTVDALNASPALRTDEETDEAYEYTGDDMVTEIFDMLYDTGAIPTLPALIYDYSIGIFDNDYDTGGGDGGVDVDALSDDEFERIMMDYLGYDDVGEFYDYLDSLDDDAYFDLIDEVFGTGEGGGEGISPDDLSDDEIDRLLMDYLGYDDIDAYYDYIDSLDDDEYYDLIDEAIGYVDDDAEGMFTSVECREELPFDSLAAAESLSANVPPQIAEPMLQGFEQQLVDCDVWDVPASDPIENQPVVSDVPVLVMSGEYDPITPPSWGQAAADYLANSAHFVFPGIGHGAVESHPCPTSIALAFLNAPENVRNLDGACIAGMRTNFYIGD